VVKSRSLSATCGAATPLLAAIQFLTILPARVPPGGEQPALARSTAYFPLVGVLLGAALVCGDALFSAVVPPLPAATATVLLLAALTGGLHLDGLADSCDGLLAPGRTREQRLQIMRDSRIGAFGLLGLLLILLAKVMAVSELVLGYRAAALVAAPALGRWAIVLAYYRHPYARQEATPSATLKSGATARAFGIATLTALAAASPLGLPGLACIAAAGLVAAGLSIWIVGRLQGITGDTCGAMCELTELTAWLALAAVLRLLG
jgi:adenosylcobinamide-GDP ribazoletransferase